MCVREEVSFWFSMKGVGASIYIWRHRLVSFAHDPLVYHFNIPTQDQSEKI
jgi:hypothetical protein